MQQGPDILILEHEIGQILARFRTSKQLHLQEVTVDSRYENYTMTKRKKEAGIRAVFDDESGTPRDSANANGIIPGEGLSTLWTL